MKLTEAEKQLLADRVLGGASPSMLMVRAVEAIVAARVAEAQAKALEDAADELLVHSTMTSRMNRLVWESASRIVRGLVHANTARAAALRPSAADPQTGT